MIECKYEGCGEETFEDSGHCILHVELPEDEESADFKKINNLKEKKVQEKVNIGDFNFEGAKLFNLILSKVEIPGNLNFNNSLIKNIVELKRVKIRGRALFTNSKLGNFRFNSSHVNIIRFDKSKICSLIFSGEKDVNEFKIGIISFDGNIEEHGVLDSVSFNGGLINGDASFSGIRIHGDFEMYLTKVSRLVTVKSCIIDGNVTLERVTIDENCNFNGSTLGKGVFFTIFEIYGKLEFEGTKFKLHKGQENACREAKNVWERLGDRDKADRYFYREMEAKRKQKSKLINILEYFLIQWPFEYGTNPYKVLMIWVLVIVGFSIGFWLLNAVNGVNNPFDYLWFSVFSATGFDYGIYQLKSQFQWLVSIEVVFGIFIWAAFLVIFARKYMR